MREETPAQIYFNGAVIDWQSAKVHVWSETALRATNVFEGARAYWDRERCVWHLVKWPEHLRRLLDSAFILRIPHRYESADFDRGTREILRALPYREHMYVRPTIYVEEGRYSHRFEDVRTGMYVAAFPVPRPAEGVRSLRCLVSAWRRSTDLDAPPRVKAGASYSNLRLPRIEAAEYGFDDAILLNHRGTVSELTGAALFLVRGGRVVTPPFSAGILESITRSVSIQLLAEEMKMEVQEREVDRTELYVADEVFAVGTLAEIAAVVEIDRRPVAGGAPGSVTRKLAERYCELVLGQAEDRYGWLTDIEADSTPQAAGTV